MIRNFLIPLFSFITITVFCQGRVGINTTAPSAMLHVKDSSVVFTTGSLPGDPGPPPVSGMGTRFMWYADKAAFRVGRAFMDDWDEHNTGLYSIAMGYQVKASGTGSLALGSLSYANGGAAVAIGQGAVAELYGIALCFDCMANGTYSTALGKSTNAFGDHSTAMGLYSTSFGQYSVAIGTDNLALGEYSTALGHSTVSAGNTSIAMGSITKASGYSSASMGYGTVANGYAGTVLGHFNDSIVSPQTSISPTTPVFIVGNGDSPTARSNAMTILKNGKIGIGLNNPNYPLNFSTSNGDKISLFGNGGNHYGFGIQNNLLQIHADVMSSDIAFGYGTSASFTETMRVKGNGRVGIGTNAPLYKVDIADRIRLRTGPGGESAGIWFNNIENTAAVSFIGMLNSEYIGIYGEQGSSWNLMMSTVTGNVGIGLQNPIEKLHVTGNGKFTGAVFASCGTLSCSDIRYKHRISPLSSSLENILLLQGIYYYWDKEKFPGQQFNDARQIGFIAQEVEKLYPEMVHTDADGYKSVDYSRMTPVLLEAIKEQQMEIEELKEKVERLMLLMGER